MKTPNQLLSILALFSLLGAGCTTTGSTTTTSDTSSTASEVTTETQEEPDTSGSATATATTNTSVTTPLIDIETNTTAMVALNIRMESGNFYFKPDTITAKAGQTVNITFSDNEGYHTIVVDEIDFKKTVTAGETITFVAPSKPGSYPFICDVGKHAAMGMVGTLIVQ